MQILKSFFVSQSLLSYRKPTHMWVPVMNKSSVGKRPKKKMYHRVEQLDKVMDLRKKPALILKLKSIIQSQKTQSIRLRDLEKEVGFVRKWNFMAVVEKYPMLFYVSGGPGTPPAVMLTEKSKKIADEEEDVMKQMEPILVKNLRKLLMLSVDCRLPMETVEIVHKEMGLPKDFETSLVLQYPQYFSLKEINGRNHIQLENWDSSLAVTCREESLAQKGISSSMVTSKRVRITKDGNFVGPFAFPLSYPSGFRLNKIYLEEVQKWQKLEFPSPYLNARRFELVDPKSRKRAVAVIHELLSLTMEKKLTSFQIDAFHSEYRLPAKLLVCLIRHHGMFYITNKGAKSTVILKEAYDGTTLIHKCPLLLFREKFVALSGGMNTISSEISRAQIVS